MQSRLLFLLAILMGIITTAIFFYTNQTEAPEPVEEVPMQDVVVLAQDVSENQLLTKDDVKLKTIPKDQVHPAALSNMKEVQGKFSTADMVKGEVVLSHRLKSSKEEQSLVSRKIKEGYRAVSIGVDMVRSVTNLINPEDYVDIVFTYGKPKEGEQPIINDNLMGLSETLLNNKKSVILFEKIRVLAVGKKMITNANGEKATAEYSQVTLELKPQDMVTLVNATEQGSIHLALHSRIVKEEEKEGDEE